MKSRPLLPPLIASLLLLLVMELAAGAWSRRLPYFHKLEEIRSAQNPNLLFVGNSLLDGRVDASAIEAASSPQLHLVPLDSALGATEPPDQLLLFDYSSQCHPGIKTLILGIYDFQLTAPDHSQLSDLTGNRVLAVDRRFPASEVAAVYGFDRFQSAQFDAMRALPIVAYRTNVWKYTELLRRKMEAMGMPAVATNSMGRVNDFAALEASSVESFDAQARAFLVNPALNQSYESMFDQARKDGMRVVVVLMPMSPSHRQTFYERPVWPQYKSAVESLLQQRGIRIIDASNWMPSETDFVDHLHMSDAAAHDFSARIGKLLANGY